ncbi:MAG: substrate-binding domain-containing protein [Candidatus Weimeria sp.]
MTAQKKEEKTISLKQNSSVNSKKRDRIGIIFYGAVNTDFFKAVHKGLELEAAASDAKPELITEYSAINPIEQVKVIDQMVKSGIKGLIISPMDDPIVADTIKKISSDGLPVVTVHTDIPDSGRIAYVGTDPYKAGQVAGAQMSRICEDGTEIGIVTGSRQLRVHEERTRGFVDYINSSGKNLLISSISENRDNDYKSYELVQKMMSDNPGISAFFFATTGGVYGGCKGIFTMTTRLKFKVITLGVFDATREFMKKGLIDCAVYQSPMDQGIDAMRILTDKIYSGRDPEKDIYYEELSIKTHECLYL